MIKSQIYALKGHVDQNEFKILFLSNGISQKKTEIIFDLLCKTAIIIRVSSNFRQTTVFFQRGTPQYYEVPIPCNIYRISRECSTRHVALVKRNTKSENPSNKKEPNSYFFREKAGGGCFLAQTKVMYPKCFNTK